MMWLFSALLSLMTTNLILTKALGTSTLMAASKSRSNLLLLSVLITVFSILGCILTGELYQMLGYFGWMIDSHCLPLMYTLVVSVIYLVVLLAMFSLCGKHFGKLKKYVHLSAFNCAVTGTMYLNYGEYAGQTALTEQLFGNPDISILRESIGGFALFGFQTGLGFLLASLMLSAVKNHLYSDAVPASFRGMPAVMVYIGMLSLAVYALTI